ncbi:DUF4198 domain-containing protein [Thiovibrio sp. JS02]
MNAWTKRLPCWLTVSVLTLTLLGAQEACAHYPWIEMENYAPAAQGAQPFHIGWGHTFPSENFLAADDLEEIFILSATGAKIPVAPESATEFISRQALADGAYLVAGRRKSSFYTKTVDGGKRQSKKGLDNVVKCSWSTMSMKGIVNVGARQEAVDQAVGHPLEIIPLVNPARLKVGDTLPVRVLFKGQPFSGEMAAVYHGHADKKESQAPSITTDQNGRGGITLGAPGIWLLRIQHELPFSQPEECDAESYVATLTFSVR